MAAFVVLGLYFPAAVAVLLLLVLLAATEGILIAALLLTVAVGAILQFSGRCPRCGANLGWQVRLGIPKPAADAA